MILIKGLKAYLMQSNLHEKPLLTSMAVREVIKETFHVHAVALEHLTIHVPVMDIYMHDVQHNIVLVGWNNDPITTPPRSNAGTGRN